MGRLVSSASGMRKKKKAGLNPPYHPNFRGGKEGKGGDAATTRKKKKEGDLRHELSSALLRRGKGKEGKSRPITTSQKKKKENEGSRAVLLNN